MIVIDDRGVIQSFSSAAERQFGWTAAEAIGRNVSVLMPESSWLASSGSGSAESTPGLSVTSCTYPGSRSIPVAALTVCEFTAYTCR